MLLTPCASEHAATIASSLPPYSPPPLLHIASTATAPAPLPRTASSLAYYYVNSFRLFPFSAALLTAFWGAALGPLFFLASFSLQTCAQTFKSIAPRTTLPVGAWHGSAIVMQNASTRANQATNVLKLTENTPCPARAAPPPPLLADQVTEKKRQQTI